MRCSRCQDIDILAMLRECEHDLWDYGSSSRAVRLGTRAPLQFQRQCRLCSLLSALVPEKPKYPDADLYLIPAKSLHRIEPDIDVRTYEGAKFRKYTMYAYIGQKERDENRGEFSKFTSCAEAPDAVGIGFSKNGTNDSEAMLVRKTNTSQLNISLIRSWLSLCEKNHPTTCELQWFPDLRRIRLVDVWSRQVVAYPTHKRCEYVCLSYVWGRFPQPARKINSYLESLPATIEDAITLVRLLGKQYLWVDSVWGI
jgi:Heterokaryon incompatibility protein (HET)